MAAPWWEELRRALRHDRQSGAHHPRRGPSRSRDKLALVGGEPVGRTELHDGQRGGQELGASGLRLASHASTPNTWRGLHHVDRIPGVICSWGR